MRSFKHREINAIIYRIMMLANVATAFFGVLIFLYIFWKRLKEDYAANIIFSVSFYILLGITVGWLIAVRLLPDWFFWISATGAALGLGLGMLRYRVKFYESTEALGVGVLPWLSFLYLRNSVERSSLVSFLTFLVVLVLIYLFYYLDTHYREFTWYASGKVGFAGLCVVGLLFLARTTASLLGISMLSFIGNLRIEAAFSGVAAFVCFVLLYNLSKGKG